MTREVMQQALEACEVLEKLFKQVEAAEDCAMSRSSIECTITARDLRKGLYAAATLREALAQPVEPTALRGTDAQILIEREITASAIQGAMAYGYQNGEYPPDDSAWLRPFWEIGRRDAEREELISAQPVQPAVLTALQAVSDAMYDPADGDDLLDKLENLRPVIEDALSTIAQPVQPAEGKVS